MSQNNARVEAAARALSGAPFPSKRSIEKARRILAAADAIGAEDGWRPIETAPKKPRWSDGRHRHGPTILAYPVWGEVAIVHWWDASDERDPECHNFLDEGGNAAHPTHWRPLPPSPSPEGET